MVRTKVLEIQGGGNECRKMGTQMADSGGTVTLAAVRQEPLIWIIGLKGM